MDFSQFFDFFRKGGGFKNFYVLFGTRRSDLVGGHYFFLRFRSKINLPSVGQFSIDFVEKLLSEGE